MNPFRTTDSSNPACADQASAGDESRSVVIGADSVRHVTPRERFLAAITAMALLLPLGVACLLEPDARGHGTHQQLGLPPCTLVALFGIRCPTCGMTTSWAAVVRGRLIDGLGANVGGVLLALATMGTVIGLSATAALGRRPRWFPDTNGFAWGGIAIATVTLIDWAVRILIF